MTGFTTYLTAAAAMGVFAAPAAAQYYPQQPTYPQQYPQQQYPQGYPQTYPQQYPQGYGQPGYGYNQGTTGNPVTDIIDSLLGNRYSVTDRQAIRQCANAARAQAAQQFGQNYGHQYAYGGSNNGYGQQAYAGTNLRVTSIGEVERRSDGLRVTGTLGSGAGYGGQYGYQYGHQNGYQNGYQGQGYGAAQLSFRCNVDYHGAVTGLRVRPVDAYHG